MRPTLTNAIAENEIKENVQRRRLASRIHMQRKGKNDRGKIRGHVMGDKFDDLEVRFEKKIHSLFGIHVVLVIAFPRRENTKKVAVVLIIAVVVVCVSAPVPGCPLFSRTSRRPTPRLVTSFSLRPLYLRPPVHSRAPLHSHTAIGSLLLVHRNYSFSSIGQRLSKSWKRKGR